jgi:hypothetical protein
MGATNRHDDILNFMQAKRVGVETGQEMVYDPVTKKFVVRAEDSAGDQLPTVTREDLQAFHGVWQ